MECREIKIWRLEESHCGDSLYTLANFKNYPTVDDLTVLFKVYDSVLSEDEAQQLLDTRYVKIKSSEYYLTESELIENDMGIGKILE